ncbi:hypothetical protein V6N12_026069 [Hibiscus sabdariffa]|uniref:40S ribosomal protein S30 n=1 Tax=Hibiscus sabdariffa TaxID=183260 RepID=A0ABR2DQP6_9ROSI
MGKVHGSLARAGKVRGQTPKVAKQDKKKKPRGRAYKRMQYNRRFVTAVVGFGKKRGPNSSEKIELNIGFVSYVVLLLISGFVSASSLPFQMPKHSVFRVDSANKRSWDLFMVGLFLVHSMNSTLNAASGKVGIFCFCLRFHRPRI